MTAQYRVFVAGEAGAPLLDAAVAWLRVDPRCEVVGIRTTRFTEEELRQSDPDLLVSAAFPYFIPENVLLAPSIGSVGLHPSLLPRYRGAYPLWWALRANEAEVGLSLFELTNRLDAGGLFVQLKVDVRPGDNFNSLYTRVADLVPSAMDAFFSAVARDGRLPDGTPQDEARATLVTTPPKWLRAYFRLYWALRRIARRGTGATRTS